MATNQDRERWLQNFKAQIEFMLEQMGSEESVDSYVIAIADFLGVEPSVIRESEGGQQVIESFRRGNDLTREELERLIIAGAPEAETFDEALEELSQDWQTNYNSAFRGTPD